MSLTDFIVVTVIITAALFFSEEKGRVERDRKELEVMDVMDNDRLRRMWDQQTKFMRLLQEKRGFPQFPTDISSKKGQQFLKDIRNHIMEELFEAGQHLKNAKSHRATEIPEVDREAYKEELVDALHLYFELVIASGVTLEELYEAYMAKGNTNFDRIRNGY